jgi:hypothetical protein
MAKEDHHDAILEHDEKNSKNIIKRHFPQIVPIQSLLLWPKPSCPITTERREVNPTYIESNALKRSNMRKRPITCF